MQQLPTTGAPSPSTAECLTAFAAQYHITLHVTRVAAEYQPVEALVIWRYDGTAMALVPQRQDPAVTLAQLRAAVAERQEEQGLAVSFQAAVAAWRARTQAGR